METVSEKVGLEESLRFQQDSIMEKLEEKITEAKYIINITVARLT